MRERARGRGSVWARKRRGRGSGGGGLHQLMIHMAGFFFGGVRVVWFGWEWSEVEWSGVMYLSAERLFVDGYGNRGIWRLAWLGGCFGGCRKLVAALRWRVEEAWTAVRVEIRHDGIGGHSTILSLISGAQYRLQVIPFYGRSFVRKS